MFSKSRLLLLSFLLFSMQLFAFNTAPGVENNPDNYLGPYWQGQATFSFLSDSSALSTLVELGNRNYRINETLGFSDQEQRNRLKIGVEYLKQNIDYTFYSGVTRKWVNQIATGLTYQHLADMDWVGYFEIGGFYSHAPNHTLSTRNGTLIQDNNDVILNFANERRIAGSNAGGANAGAAFYLWQGAELGLALNYDYVHYDMYYEAHNSAKGFGGSAFFNQYLSDRFKIDAVGEMRAPFDYYNLGISWLIPSSVGKFAIGVSGGYVNGKHLLPNSKTLAISLKYIGDSQNTGWTLPPCPKTLSEWTSKPAVYLPQVLAVKDERITYSSPVPPCLLPIFTGPIITDQTVPVGQPIAPINAAASFSGEDLTFTLVGDPWGTVTIDPVTGIISGNADGEPSSVQYTVQATNSCGVTSSNPFTLTSCEPPVFIGPEIADNLFIDAGLPIDPIPAGTLFSGPDLTFSLLGDPAPWGTVNIDPVTGLISGIAPDGEAPPFEVTWSVQADNDCGTAESNDFTLSLTPA